MHRLKKRLYHYIFGIHKFHQCMYLYGRKFCVVTDYKPLCTILGPKGGDPYFSCLLVAALRAILLSAYNNDIKLHPTKAHCNAHHYQGYIGD